MSNTSYYYDPPGSENVIEEPGELCNYCSKLATITRKGTLIKMPTTPLDKEYGYEGEQMHAHPQCALEMFRTYDLITKEMRRVLEEKGILTQ